MFIVEILNRAVKLLIVIFVAMIFYGWIISIIGDGPIYSLVNFFNTETMEKYWYTYMLFINNFVPSVEKQGMVWASFLSMDLHLFIIFLPFVYLLRKKWKIGISAIVLMMFGSLITSFCWAMDADVIIMPALEPFKTIRYQQKFWYKAFPYGIGIITGWCIWRYHNENIDGTLLKKVTDMIIESSVVSVGLHLIGLSMIVLVVCLYHPVTNYNHYDHTFPAVVVLTLSQVLIPVGVALNFVPMSLNKSARLRAVMSMPLIKPLSNLLVMIVPMCGSIYIWIYYSSFDGAYMNSKYLFMITLFATFLLIVFSFVLIVLFVYPAFNILRLLTENYRYKDDKDMGVEGYQKAQGDDTEEDPEEDPEGESSQSDNYQKSQSSQRPRSSDESLEMPRSDVPKLLIV